MASGANHLAGGAGQLRSNSSRVRLRLDESYAWAH
ncbi:MAG: hypothetical protein HN350_11240 [Phycisphaerales bacterium]|nr:hypothetical protein [Phycisphaerales bacterium]